MGSTINNANIEAIHTTRFDEAALCAMNLRRYFTSPSTPSNCRWGSTPRDGERTEPQHQGLGGLLGGSCERWRVSGLPITELGADEFVVP
jgi:hypothetical protein